MHRTSDPWHRFLHGFCSKWRVNESKRSGDSVMIETVNWTLCFKTGWWGQKLDFRFKFTICLFTYTDNAMISLERESPVCAVSLYHQVKLMCSTGRRLMPKFHNSDLVCNLVYDQVLSRKSPKPPFHSLMLYLVGVYRPHSFE